MGRTTTSSSHSAKKHSSSGRDHDGDPPRSSSHHHHHHRKSSGRDKEEPDPKRESNRDSKRVRKRRHRDYDEDDSKKRSKRSHHHDSRRGRGDVVAPDEGDLGSNSNDSTSSGHHKEISQKHKRRTDSDGKEQSRRHKHDRSHTRNHDKKSDKKKKDKKSSSKHHSKRGDTKVIIDPKRSLLQVDKSKLVPLGNPLGNAPERLLDETDYFAYHKHLWLYLYRDCSIAFNDLTSEESHQAFADFCRLYNAGTLEAAYYNNEDGLPAAALDECKTTRHRWGFRITDQEDKNLHVLQEGVRKQTEYRGGPASSAATVPPPVLHNNNGTAPPMEDEQQQQQQQQQRSSTTKFHAERQQERASNRRLREHVRMVQDELTGGAGSEKGRERLLAQRRERADKIHGAARAREQDAVALELDDAALYGASDRAPLERAKQRAARQVEQKQARLAELQSKEKEKQAAMLEMLGLSGKIKPGEKIKIAPRSDD